MLPKIDQMPLFIVLVFYLQAIEISASENDTNSELVLDEGLARIGFGPQNTIDCGSLVDCEGVVCPNSVEKDKGQFTTCGDDGICYCSDQLNEYDGVKPAAFSDPSICTQVTSNTDPCYMKCNRRKGTVSQTTGAYSCNGGPGIRRCWCDYRLQEDKFEPCRSHPQCAKNEKMMSICGGTATCLNIGAPGVIKAPHNCLCANGFTDTDKMYCQEDAFCLNTCRGVAYPYGQACTSMIMGKQACFCSAVNPT